MTENH